MRAVGCHWCTSTYHDLVLVTNTSAHYDICLPSSGRWPSFSVGYIQNNIGRTNMNAITEGWATVCVDHPIPVRCGIVLSAWYRYAFSTLALVQHGQLLY